MILLVIINMFLAFVLEPMFIRDEDRCSVSLVLYYSGCLAFTFIGGIIFFRLFRWMVVGK